MKNIEDVQLDKRSIILILANYFIGYMFLYPMIFSLVSHLLFPDYRSIHPLMEILLYLTVLFITIKLAWPLLKVSYRAMVFNVKHFLLQIGQNYILLYFATAVSSVLISYVSGMATSSNQTAIETAVGQNVPLMIFMTVIFASIVEELVFRGAIYQAARTRFSYPVAMAMSVVSFGFLHVAQSLLTQNYQDLWFLLVYACLGCFLCRAYEKTDSIYAAMGVHAINNLIGVLMMIL